LAASSLLGVFAHPDDESLSSGGLLARQAAGGARTAVVTATWVQDTTRAEELAGALRILGAGSPRMLGYADAEVPESAPGCARLCDAPLDEAVRRLVAHIRDFRPEVIVTHDGYGGLVGHPDHVHTHRLTILAAHAAGLEQLYPDAGPAWRPRALYLATHPRSVVPAISDIIGAHKAVYSVPDAELNASVDVTPWLDQKVAAILAHRSEVARGALPGVIAQLPESTRQTLLATEWYTRHPISS
jgi:N-acetyl-1-D-myo-inositol-2-amino-2-deoxy-alpha-D-glucopyranoside deacetylase